MSCFNSVNSTVLTKRNTHAIELELIIKLVREMVPSSGLEPELHKNRILSAARLPIPPGGHEAVAITKLGCMTIVEVLRFRDFR